MSVGCLIRFVFGGQAEHLVKDLCPGAGARHSTFHPNSLCWDKKANIDKIYGLVFPELILTALR